MLIVNQNIFNSYLMLKSQKVFFCEKIAIFQKKKRIFMSTRPWHILENKNQFLFSIVFFVFSMVHVRKDERLDFEYFDCRIFLLWEPCEGENLDFKVFD